jgi:membrane dipeptidase
MYKIADSHCDYSSSKLLDRSDEELYDHGTIEDIISGGVNVQVFAAWIPRELNNKYEYGLKLINYIRNIINESNGKLILCDSVESFAYVKPMKAVLAIESGETIDCNADVIKDVYKLGIRMLSLTWNDENDFAFGCYNNTGALKPSGIKAINELNRLDIALDLSHINEQGFWEAAEIYKHIPCASHSCAYKLTPNNRNLKDDQIKYIINKYGYIGVIFYPEFLRGGSFATIDDIISHIEYILSFGGEDCIGFGSDFFGMQYTPEYLSSPSDFQKIPEAMAKRNYSDELISKICYGNFEKYILKFL